MNGESFIELSGGVIARALVEDLRKERSSDPLAASAEFGRTGEGAPTAADHDAAVALALTSLAARWDAIAPELDSFDSSRLRDRWLLPLLRELGFDPVYQRAAVEAGGERFTITHRGWQGADGPPMMLTADDLDERLGRGQRGPHDELQAMLNASSELRWGIVADARRLRVVRDFHHRRTRGYAEFELDAIFEARSYPDFLALYRVCHASRFRAREDRVELLEDLHLRSLDTGVAIGRRLQPQVKRALEAIANGVATPGLFDDLAKPAVARAFHRELLVFLYRLLFLLFAERRGLLPSSGVYAESYAVSRLRELAGQAEHVVEPRRGDLYEGLKVTFRALAGDGADALGAFPFNGPLFGEERTPRLSRGHCQNRALLRAMRELTTVELEGTRQYVNFADLGVEEIGSVYESLLDFFPTVVSGRIELRPTSEERSDLGSYYTPQELVDLVLTKSLDHVIDERAAAAGDSPAEQEAALLDITVIDPACGSAAFLIAAVDRLALRLAEIRRDGRPDDRDLRHARRDVLQHCIYGLDKDETAVELAKVALWIHCAVEDRPLSFLDHHIQHGDSLVGWSLSSVLPAEIPDEAYESKSGDSTEDKATRRAWRDANRQSDQLRLTEQPISPGPAPTLPHIVDADEETPSDVRVKADAYVAWRASDGVRRLERAADLWTAAFLWPVEAGPAPTTREYRLALGGQRTPHDETAERLAAETPFFHWAMRFPEIRTRGGFDCIIGNPPWEQYKAQQQEWFAPRAPEIAALSGKAREDAIAALAETNPALHDQWVRHVRSVDRMGQWARLSGRFAPTGAEANTYLLFAEHDADTLRAEGRAGVLLKSQLALDRSASRVFHRLIDDGRLVELHDIVNGGPTGTNLIFPNVDGKERFAIVALAAADAKRDGFDATVMNWTLAEAATRMPRRYTRGILASLNPHTRTLTSFRRNEELEVALTIADRLDVLDCDEGGSNPWQIEYCSLFHSSGDAKRGLFLKREDLESEGWILGVDRAFRRGNEEALPLYEGQMVNRYDHRAKTYEGFAGGNKYGRGPGIPATTDKQKADPCFEIEPRYWVARDKVAARLAARVGDRMMLAFGNTGRPWREQRSAAGALLPRVPATHGLPVLTIPVERAFEFVGVFNSTTFDFSLRGRVPGANLALLWVIAQIPAPAPGLDPRIADKAKALSLTSYSVAGLVDVKPHAWEPDERYRLDIVTDALVARTYGLDRQAYAIVLDSFEVMARMQTQAHGYYKLREDCLAAFDSLPTEDREGATIGSA